MTTLLLLTWDLRGVAVFLSLLSETVKFLQYHFRKKVLRSWCHKCVGTQSIKPHYCNTVLQGGPL